MEQIDRVLLEKLLNENVPVIVGKKLWMWGTGDTALLYQEGLRRLEAEGICIQGYCDNNSTKWGREFVGKPIVSPQELQAMENIIVLIGSTQSDVIEALKKQLEDMQIEAYPADELVLKLHRAEVLECYDSLADAHSKNVYADIIVRRMQGAAEYKVDSKEDYFMMPPFSNEDENEVYVDCGAYTGDTIEQYVKIKDGCYQKIIAFEPDKNNFKKMQERVAQLTDAGKIKEGSVQLNPFGVGDKSESGLFERYENNNGVGSKFVSTASDMTDECRIVSLDDFLEEKYTFLKADVEGYEYKMLLGAQKGIQKYTPLLTICLYHNAVDLYSIPLLIKKMVPEYKLAVRHHFDKAAGTVLYAWIEN